MYGIYLFVVVVTCRQGDDRYGQVNNGYAETGPPSAKSTEKAAAAVPDYAVVDKSAKKKNKNEKVDDTYAKVDMSKKRSKKVRQSISASSILRKLLLTICHFVTFAVSYTYCRARICCHWYTVEI